MFDKLITSWVIGEFCLIMSFIGLLLMKITFKNRLSQHFLNTHCFYRNPEHAVQFHFHCLWIRYFSNLKNENLGMYQKINSLDLKRTLSTYWILNRELIYLWNMLKKNVTVSNVFELCRVFCEKKVKCLKSK